MEYNPFIDEVEKKLGLKLTKNASLFESTLVNEKEGHKILQNYLESLVNFSNVNFHPLILKSPWKLVATEMLVTSLKSVSLGLMTVENHITAPRAFELSRIEEDFQAYFFGRVPGAHDLDEAQLS